MPASIRIGYLSTLYHTSHLIRQFGWVKQEMKRDAGWILFGTGPEMVEAFSSNEIDLGYIGLPPAMIGISRGIPLVCVGGGHIEGTVMVAGTGTRSLAEAGETEDFLQQFSGCRVGTPAAGSIHDVIFRSLLDRYRCPDVHVVNYTWADLIPYAFNKGDVAAAVGTPPLAILCERNCGTRLMAPPESLWPFNPSYGIVVHRRMLQEGSLIEGFLHLHERACNLLRECHEEVIPATLQALPGLDENFVQRTLALSPWYCASLPEPYVQASLDFLPVLEAMGYLDDRLDRERIFETEFIERVHPESHHYRDGAGQDGS